MHVQQATGRELDRRPASVGVHEVEASRREASVDDPGPVRREVWVVVRRRGGPSGERSPLRAVARLCRDAVRVGAEAPRRNEAVLPDAGRSLTLAEELLVLEARTIR